MGQYDRTIRKDDTTIAVPIRIYRNLKKNLICETYYKGKATIRVVSA